ncbi:hypothetical protein EYZ11_005472 [Aspergillus tanneri]|uniref:Uncharacterized protein n=1 Tax=Aspergillus tanneri TaxID=1220188 RepID=A0A4V3UPG3_9EURO|nr:hypothetical protein EYZ11_005472 [Aspergillus tanneri]
MAAPRGKLSRSKATIMMGVCLIRDFGYAANNRHKSASCQHPADVSSKYRGLMRQMPTRVHIEVLLETFFDGVNWHYDVVDEITFWDQLDVWAHTLPGIAKGTCCFAARHSCFSRAVIPSPHSNIAISPSDDERLELLKYGAGMSLLDVAKELSDTGSAILELLGKRGVTVGTVQVGLLRAAFLKSSGLVVEAWHTLGSAIRDARSWGCIPANACQKRCLVPQEWNLTGLGIVSAEADLAAASYLGLSYGGVVGQAKLDCHVRRPFSPSHEMFATGRGECFPPRGPILIAPLRSR